MLETALSTLFGGVLRMAPEVLKWVDRKDERKHELAMFDLQIEADKQKGQIEASRAQAAIDTTEIQAIIEATRAQSVQTGVKWVDAVNSLMRPLITFWWVIVLYTAALVAKYVTLLDAGESYTTAILQLWGPEELAICASIISFWFVDRSLKKGLGK